MSHLIQASDVIILAYFLALNTIYALLLVLSIPEIWEQTRLAEDEDFQRLMQSDALPPITILVPAYNESATIEASVTAILTLEYRTFEVVVVNDGSKDDTLERLRHAFDLYEVPRTYPETISTQALRGVYRSRTRTRLLVIDKENGGKADSLNAAINASRFPLVIAADADTLIEPDALLRLTRPFLLGRRIAAVGGTVRVANSCTVQDGRVTDARVPRRFLPGIQVVEYLRAFLFGRLGWNRLGGSLVISGAFGLFPRNTSSPSAGTTQRASWRTWTSSCACTVICGARRSATRYRSSPIPWPGRRSPKRDWSWAASASVGTAGSSPRCGSTRACSSTHATAAWDSSPCRSTPSVRCSRRSWRCSAT